MKVTFANNLDLRSNAAYVEIFGKTTIIANGGDTVNLGEGEAGMTPASLTLTTVTMEVDEMKVNIEEPRKLKLDETRTSCLHRPVAFP